MNHECAICHKPLNLTTEYYSIIDAPTSAVAFICDECAVATTVNNLHDVHVLTLVNSEDTVIDVPGSIVDTVDVTFNSLSFDS